MYCTTTLQTWLMFPREKWTFLHLISSCEEHGKFTQLSLNNCCINDVEIMKRLPSVGKSIQISSHHITPNDALLWVKWVPCTLQSLYAPSPAWLRHEDEKDNQISQYLVTSSFRTRSWESSPQLGSFPEVSIHDSRLRGHGNEIQTKWI